MGEINCRKIKYDLIFRINLFIFDFKELFKAFSKYIVDNTDNIFQYIEGSKINYAYFIQYFYQSNQKEYKILCDKLENMLFLKCFLPLKVPLGTFN